MLVQHSWDYLRAHPEDTLAYRQLKEGLAETYRDDLMGYTNGKNEIVETIDKRASAWKGN